jgi:putative transposase
MTVRFIDTNRAELGVEPIYRTLQVAPSTCYAAKSRPSSARSLRDALMVPVPPVLFQANYSVYGAHKLWKAARRAGYDIGRDQVARLMKVAGAPGASRPSGTHRRRPRRPLNMSAPWRPGKPPALVPGLPCRPAVGP